MSFIFLCTNQYLNITIMTKKVSYVTKEGLKKLQDELDNLQNVERPKISKAIEKPLRKEISPRMQSMMQRKMPRGYWRLKSPSYKM